MLLHLRAKVVGRKGASTERLAMHAVGWIFRGRRRFELAQKLGRVAQAPLVRLGALRPWTRTRDLKPIARRSFREWWRRR